ncbi:MAG TPA: tetracycline resistance MFS efflux pump [Flavobacteriales bacterium]|nr:tetracycline resistance MFS efflux pump [Flavobacteriales bacterium]
MQKRKAGVGFVLFIIFMDSLGFGIIIPIMPELIISLTGVGTSEASEIGGYLLFAYAVCQFIFSPIIGGLSDKFGRRPVLLLSSFGFAIDYLFLAYAPTILLLFVGRVISGVMGASFATAAAYIADVSEPEKRAQNFGMVGAAFGLGFIIGPAIGGVLGEVGIRIPFLAAAGLSAINWVYGMFILPESLSLENRRAFDIKRANPFGVFKQLSKHKVILGLIVSMIFVYLASHAVQSTWAFYTKLKFDWTMAEIGYSLSFVGVLTVAVQGGLIRWLIPKIGQKKAAYWGIIFYFIGLVFFGFALSGWMMYAAMVVYCLGGLAGPALQGIMSNQLPSSEQGELQGANTSMMSATAIVGPILMTHVFSYFSGDSAPIHIPGAAMYLAAIFTLISLFLCWRTLRSFTE